VSLSVLGIDPGLTVSGFGILEYMDRHTRVVAYGTVKTPAGYTLPEKLKNIYESANKLIEKYNPGVLAIEDTFYHKNVRSALVLGQVKGIWILAAAMHSIPSKEYAPRKVKNSVTGNGNATKVQVQFMLKKIFDMGKKSIPLDASDALAVAYCCISQLQGAV
jgi:crossover junction endodeoxyribonuclease RuvC